MDIAATPTDINRQAGLSACDASNAYYPIPPPNATTPSPYYGAEGTDVIASGEQYYNYTCSLSNGTNFLETTAAGTVLCPVPAPSNTLLSTGQTTTFQTEAPPLPFGGITSAVTNNQQFCKSLGLQKVGASSFYPIPGPPCAFACHWDYSKQAGLGQDLWAAARKHRVSLRLDLVKLATQATIAQMRADNIPSYNNLSVGVYTFDTQITQYYPGTPGTPLNQVVCTNPGAACEAGINFKAAEQAVGCPPYGGPCPFRSGDGLTDTGIQPIVGIVPPSGSKVNNDDTAFPEDMNQLAKFLTPSGNGLTRSAPQKELILVTDGFEDDPNSPKATARQAFEYAYCTQFKNAGYAVYVLYTPYYPVVHYSYLAPDANLNGENWQDITQGLGDPKLTIAYNLQHCSSMYNADGTPNTDGYTYYISAADQSDITSALLTFFEGGPEQPGPFHGIDAATRKAAPARHISCPAQHGGRTKRLNRQDTKRTKEFTKQEKSFVNTFAVRCNALWHCTVRNCGQFPQTGRSPSGRRKRLCIDYPAASADVATISETENRRRGATQATAVRWRRRPAGRAGRRWRARRERPHPPHGRGRRR